MTAQSTFMSRVSWRAQACALALLFMLFPCSALAADASAWDGGARSAVRLIAGAAGKAFGSEFLRAGIQIRLDSGWKTYWRYPGDSGVPPRFNFARSENLDSVRVLWPAPRMFSEEGVKSIGYIGGVIFPLRVVPRDPSRPVLLRFDVDYAICERLCIPAEGRGELLLSGELSTEEEALRQAEARVPVVLGIGEGDVVEIGAVDHDPERNRFLIDVRAPDLGKLELFAEGPTTDWALPIPEPIPGGAAGFQRFALELDGAPPGASTDAVKLKLTAVAGERAVEVVIPLDETRGQHGG
jgi:DsbC/DsbD-like thiol-disulfide interchange protein